jgi:hypothetical protein
MPLIIVLNMFDEIPEVMEKKAILRLRNEFKQLVRGTSFEKIQRVWEEELIANVHAS